MPEKNPKKASNRGGRREGAGRPPLMDEPMLRLSVTLPPEAVEAARQEGAGNVSAGLRRIVADWLKR